MASRPVDSNTQYSGQKQTTQNQSQSQGNTAQSSPVVKRKNKFKKAFNWFRDNVIPIIADYESVDSEEEEQKQALKEERKLLKNPPIIKPELHRSNLRDNTPGLTGIFNHGNTCFISTIVQCLCNTEELARYMVTDEYVSDLKESHKSRRRNKFGTKGELTQQLANLLKSMWLGQYDHRISWFFIHTVMRHGDQYRGYMQHDAQEFLLWMLDNMHEDLKMQHKSKKGLFSKSKNSLPPPGLLGGQHQANKSQDTIIMQLFHGQFFSSISCKDCGRTSASLESFICLSLPIPQRQIRPLYVTIVKHSSTGSQNKKIGLTVPLICTALDIKREIATREEVPPEFILMFDVYSDSYGRILNDNDTMSEVQNRGDFLYAFILPPAEQTEGDFEFISLICMNAYMYGHYPRRFTYPFILHVKRDIEIDDIENLVMKRILAKVEAIDIDLLNVIQRLFKMKLVDGMPGKTILSGYESRPLLTAQTNRPLERSVTGAGQYYLRILLEWENDIKTRVFGRYQELVYEECESVKKTQLFFKKTHRASLPDCFQLLMQREDLCDDDEWYCSKCKGKRPGIKKLDLFGAPEVLVVHLKRFRQVGYLRQKLDTMIDFPLTNLDLTPHMIYKQAAEPYLVRGPSCTSDPLLTDTDGHKPKRRLGKKLKKSNTNYIEPTILEGITSPPTTEIIRPVPVGLDACSTGNLSTSSYSTDLDSLSHGQFSQLYDLYAVGNHHGGMTGGHYTAFCKNAVNEKWYLLDDDFVSEVNEKKVVTSHAYLLFYKRKQTSSPELLMKSSDAISPSMPSKNAIYEPNHWLKKFPVKVSQTNPVDVTKSVPPTPATPSHQAMGPVLRRSNTAPVSRRKGDEKHPASSFSRKKIETPPSKFNSTGVSVPTYNISAHAPRTNSSHTAMIAQTPSVPSFIDNNISYTPPNAALFHSLPIKKTNSQPNIAQASFYNSPAPVQRSHYISETKV